MSSKSFLYKAITLSFGICLLAGFMNGNPETEVAQFIEETSDTVKPTPNLDLGPLPANKEYVPYAYQAESTDPFALKSFVIDAIHPATSYYGERKGDKGHLSFEFKADANGENVIATKGLTI